MFHHGNERLAFKGFSGENIKIERETVAVNDQPYDNLNILESMVFGKAKILQPLLEVAVKSQSRYVVKDQP